MATHKIVVTSRPKPGHDAEFDRWYTEQHVPELLEIPGLVNCQRYRLVIKEGWEYMAIYDVDTDDLDAMMAEMHRRVADGEIVMSPVFDTYVLYCGEPIGPFQETRPEFR